MAILLAARGGLRRGEIAQLRREDLFQDLVGWSIRVTGKGGKRRDVPLHDEVSALIRACDEGWLFPGPQGHLTPHHLGKLITRALGGEHTTHTLRHRYATTTYAASKDLLAVQTLLGHSKPETTRGYVQLDAESLRAAALAA